jgi:P27 family predicted phage terminase small subunit
MGKRGPTKRPTNLALLHGERKDRVNTDEPVAPTGLPEPPDDIADDVRAVWDYTLDQLRTMKLATPADRDVLRAFCEAVVTHRKASALIAASNVLIRAQSRTPGQAAYVKNPAVQIQRDAAMVMKTLGREFGLTPSARSDIHMNAGGNSGDGDPARLLS